MPTCIEDVCNCATPFVREIFPNPELPSMTKVTVPPGVRDEVTFAVRLTSLPEGTLTLAAVRVMEDGTGPPAPPVDPPPQPKKPSIRQETRVRARQDTN